MTGSESPRRGWFITIEGPEGAGKTMQAARLADRATAAGYDVVLTREPGGTPVGERIREILLAGGPDLVHDARTDALLFNAARARLCAEVVSPALARGAIVLATRFADSTLAYQGHGAGLPLDELRALARFATGGLRPDLTVLLDVPADVGLRRKGGDELTRFERDFDVAFHRRVRDGFLALARAEPQRFAVVDADRPAAAVTADVVAAVGRVAGLNGLVAPVSDEPEAARPRIPR